jgi:hypothetical protein
MTEASVSSLLTTGPAGRAIDLLRNDNFPEWWSFVPVAGKATFIKEWTTKPLTKQACIDAYKLRSDYNGLGVVTGEFSGGLIALDIDGPLADERYQQAAGAEYEAYGVEKTMSWTSGKPGRRQILYRVPAPLIPELRHVKTLILRAEDNQWHLGHGDTNRVAANATPLFDERPYEEVVLRFNHCQSVVPGSVHPETKQPYTWLNYNNKQLELIPSWILTVLREHRKPVQWLSDADQKALDAELGETAVPSRQIRGWFFKEEVQRLLLPRLEELVFTHEVFDTYGWKDRQGTKPQRMSGCPWHGGRSGTSFQYSVTSGCWDCKACGVGGDILDFVHKIRVKDLHADRPQGPDLEVYVAELATALGFDYPACAKAIEMTTKEAPLRRLSGHEFFTAALDIDDRFENAELGDYHLMELVRDAGLTNVYRSGPQVRAALERFMLHEQQVVDSPNWQEECRGQRDYLIPDFVSKPSSIMLHARGGMGKTRLAVLLSRIVGQQLPMKVRGITVTPTAKGNVLFIGNDMSMTDYAEYLDQQGIDTGGCDKWFKFKPQWQQSQYKVLIRWLAEFKPVLVVVDSLTSVSTMIAAKEYEKEYANTLYRLARENGTVFPPTTFLWIHHNTKDGTKFRGTDTLRNAVHETWELKELSDEEKLQFGDTALILEIDKSRGMRGGDRFLVREDIEEALSLEDLTPTVKRANNGQGDETPRTLVLGILKDVGEAGMTVKELRYELNSRLTGHRGQGTHVSARTVQRWLKAWIASGLVVSHGTRSTGQRGRPEPLFAVCSPLYQEESVVNYGKTPETPVPESDSINDMDLALNPSDEGDVVKSAFLSAETTEIVRESTPLESEVTEGESMAGPNRELGIGDTTGAREPVSLNPEAETLDTASFSESAARFSDTGAQVKSPRTPRFAEGDWDSASWG